MSVPSPFPSHNLAVVSGVLSSPPRFRTLPSGQAVCQLELTTRVDGTRPSSVPIAADATLVARLDPEIDLVEGAAVVVIGEVRRRFFRAGGATQSRTEVVASRIVPARRKASAARAVNRAVAVLAGS